MSSDGNSGMFTPNAGVFMRMVYTNGRYQCTQYRHQISVTAETTLHKTHILITKCKKG